MARRVGICAAAQTHYEHDRWYDRFQGMVLDVLEKLQDKTGVEFSDGDKNIDMTISVSDDVFDARTISNNGLTDVLGGHMRCEEKVAQEGIQALYYGLTAIQSGHCDIVMVMGHCKESQGQSRNMATHVAFDPFYTRPLGMDYQAAAGLQARAYAEKSGITEAQLADVVVRARANAAKSDYYPENETVTKEEVMASAMLADPIRELHAYPVSDGAVGMILAAEDVAGKLTDNPVWITGVGNNIGNFFLGDRDLAALNILKKAADRTYKRAGISDPKGAFDIVEVSDMYAYQQPLWVEGLGLCEEGQGGKWIESGGPDADKVNLSGGTLAGNPMILGGLVRAAVAVMQLQGEAGGQQADKAKTALAHGVMGPAGQFHSVVTLARD
jgi:acetyl-CoA C-acetyltransferase